MEPKLNFDRWLGLFFCFFALIVIFIWVPLDTGSGIVEKVRRRFVIGDAMAPTLAGLVLLVGGALTALKPRETENPLSRAHLLWIAKLLGIAAISLALMRYLGPLLLSFAEGGYRPLRATIPWKYLGYLAGGTILVGGLKAAVFGTLRPRDFLIGFLAAIVIALIYDLPFDNLLLPPNGDV